MGGEGYAGNQRRNDGDVERSNRVSKSAAQKEPYGRLHRYKYIQRIHERYVVNTKISH